MIDLCERCERRPKKDHRNSKWCVACARDLKRKPKGTLTKSQIRYAKSCIGKMGVRDIAARMGVSPSNITRSCPGVSFWFKNGKLKNNPKLVRKVLAYYSKHGKPATAKAFPDISVKSIIDRPKYYGVKMKPRLKRWTNDEIVLAAKMAGLVEAKRQAKIFNRPGANEGSIRSLWMKRFGHGGGNIHGMSEWMAKHILMPGYPVTKTLMWSRRKNSKGDKSRGLILWCDMQPYLLRGLPKYITDSVKTMAAFQCWLYGTDNPKAEILRLLSKKSEVPRKRE